MLLPLLVFSRVEAKECDLFARWQEMKHVAPLETVQERSDFAIREYQERQFAAANLYQTYRKGEIHSGEVSQCLSTEEWAELSPSISRVFFQETLQALDTSPIPKIRDLVSLLEASSNRSGFLLFRVSPHFPEDQSIENQNRAGVYRGTGSLFMNFDNIAPGEWLFLFIHEVSHQVDPVLKQASATWNKKENSDAIFEMAKSARQVSDLAPSDLQLLRSYLRAGLDRGLLAEYRAWLIGFSVYDEGKEHKLWPEIPWMEEILVQKSANETYQQFTFRFLDSRFVDPKPEGLFSLPIVQQEYRKLRSEIRANPNQLPSIL